MTEKHVKVCRIKPSNKTLKRNLELWKIWFVNFWFNTKFIIITKGSSESISITCLFMHTLCSIKFVVSEKNLFYMVLFQPIRQHNVPSSHVEFLNETEIVLMIIQVTLQSCLVPFALVISQEKNEMRTMKYTKWTQYVILPFWPGQL